MSDTTTTATKPAVLDSKGTSLEKGMKVVLPAEDKAIAVVTNIEYQRQRVVLLVDGATKKIVRPASKVYVQKSKSGKIQRIERAVRAAKAPKPAETPAPAEA